MSDFVLLTAVDILGLKMCEGIYILDIGLWNP